MEGDEPVRSGVISDAGFLKWCLIYIGGAGVHHIHPVLGENPAYCQGQPEIVILLLSALIDSAGIRSAVPGVYYNFICQMVTP